MACVRIRRGRWVLDYRDQWGRRHGPAYASEEAAREALATLRAGAEAHDSITLGGYIADHWLPAARMRVDPLTYRGYEGGLRTHLPPGLRRMQLRAVQRIHVKRLLMDLGAEHRLGDSSVAKFAALLRNVFAGAIDDGLLAANPAAGMGRALGLRHHYAERVMAMTSDQLETFLAVGAQDEPGHYLELATLALAGLRIGEMRGLRLEDVDLARRRLVVERQVYDDGRVGPVKGRRGQRRGRQVVIYDALADALQAGLAVRREADMRLGRRSPWLLYPEWPQEPTAASVSAATHRLRRAMIRCLKEAGLPPHFTPHCLRHTYASLLLSGGEQLLYVSRQLGHASVAITADRYGRWLEIGPRPQPVPLYRLRNATP